MFTEKRPSSTLLMRRLGAPRDYIEAELWLRNYLRTRPSYCYEEAWPSLYRTRRLFPLASLTSTIWMLVEHGEARFLVDRRVVLINPSRKKAA